MQLNKGLFRSWLGWARSCFKMYSLHPPPARPGSAAPPCWPQPSPEAALRPKLWVQEGGTSLGKPGHLCAQQHQIPAPFCCPSLRPQGIWAQWRLEMWGVKENEMGELKIEDVCLLRVINAYLSCIDNEGRGSDLWQFKIWHSTGTGYSHGLTPAPVWSNQEMSLKEVGAASVPDIGFLPGMEVNNQAGGD